MVCREVPITVGVQSSMKWVVDHTPSVCTRVGRGTFRCRPVYVGGGDKRREQRGPVLPRATERYRERRYVYVDAANDNDMEQSSQNTINKFDRNTDTHSHAALSRSCKNHAITRKGEAVCMNTIHSNYIVDYPNCHCRYIAR